MEKYMKRLDGSIHTEFFSLHYSGITDRGQIRKANEDNFLIMANCCLFCVADGMGGHEAGVLASRSTVENVERAMNYLVDSQDATLPYGLTADMLEKPILSSVVQFTNSQVHKIAAGRTMGSTLVAAYFVDNRLDIAHVGDSRLYVWRSGQLLQLTEDHSLVYELYKTGQITEAEMRVHQMRNVITRAIGTESQVEPTLGSVEVVAGDIF
ncbi:MAG TPA: serine/threonine-protein phosphatase, partial [Desulfobulbaceae bacterium]|nr:serine/threonine-protein phosphatase [Desulfobulbaceae bacterium]